MNNINLIKEITDMRATLKKLEAEKMTELWKQFPPGVVINIYKELCKTIPELKGIPVEFLLDRTVHPFQNKQLILKKLNIKVKDKESKERFEKITTELGETWTKLFPLWKQIDVKYMNQIPRLESRLLELDYNNPELKLGYESLKHECTVYKTLGYQYLYLGEAVTYKSKLQGYEVLGNLQDTTES
jgi:hypothetical protein